MSSFVSEGEPLPDGLYFGFLHSVDADGGALAFDLAQHFIGAAANSAESEDGADQLDGYTRNPTEATRTLPVSPDVIVTHLQGTTEGVPGTLAGLAASFGPGAPEHPTLNDEYRGPSGHYWLTVRDGRVARIDEAYHS